MMRNKKIWSLLIFIIVLTIINSLNVFGFAAVGGNITYFTNATGTYTVHTFYANGTFNVTEAGTPQILLLGGGGGAGFNGGGGGAGGFCYYAANTTLGIDNYNVTIGFGGNGSVAWNSPAQNGGNTSLKGTTVLLRCDGGGGGGSQGAASQNGANGGGAGIQTTGGQGNATGNGSGYAGGRNYNFDRSAGGAGAGINGTNATSTTNGDGGYGVNTSINGSIQCFAGGGGGASSIGGAAGGASCGANSGAAATNGTGAGGSGTGASRGGNGGSGLIIVTYLSSSTSVNRINFVSQEPSNVTINTIFAGTSVNITYNYTTANLSSPSLNVTVYHSETTCYTYINGSCYRLNNTYQNYAPTSNITTGNNTLISWSLGENDIIPRTGNVNITHASVYINYSLSNANSYIATQLLNISNAERYNILEVAGYSSLNNSKVYACNSSYGFASQVATDSNCIEIGTLKSTANHSQDQLIPFSIVNGLVNNQLPVTNVMYFLQRGANTGTNTEAYVDNYTRTGATRTTTNGGTTWTNQTYTTLVHLHQLNGTEYFNYLAIGVYNTTETNYTGLATAEKIDLPSLNPSPPVITNPFDTTQATRYLNITYTNATSNTLGVNISYYNITLLNSDFTFNRTIRGNNTLNNSYLWDVYSQNLTIGTWHVTVTAYDTASQSASDTETFNLTTNAEINVTALNANDNTTITTFNITTIDLNTSTTTITASSNNVSVVNIIAGNTINMTIDAPGYSIDSYQASNWTIPTNNYTFSIYTSNSIRIYIYNINTNLLINDTTSTIVLNLGTSSTSTTTTNGTKYIDNLTAGVYDISIIAAGYGIGSYTVTVANRTTQILNAYLTPNATNIGFYTKSLADDPLYDTDIVIQKSINGSLVTINNKNSDILGYALFELEEGGTYHFIMTPVGYTSKTFDMEVYSFNSPYTIRFTNNQLQYYTGFFQSASYSYFPNATSLSQGVINFGINSYSINATIVYTAVVCPGTGNTTNITGSPSGATANITINLSNYAGTFTCTYYLDTIEFDTMALPITYYISTYSAYNNSNLLQASQKLSRELDTMTSGAGWKAIIAVFIILVVALTTHQLSAGMGKASTIAALAGTALFAYLDFLPVSISIFIILIGAFLTFYREVY